MGKYSTVKSCIKLGLNTLGGIGGTYIADKLIEKIAPASMNPLEKFFWKVGAFFAGGLAGEAIGDYAERWYDECEEVAKKVVTIRNKEGKIVFGQGMEEEPEEQPDETNRQEEKGDEQREEA